MATICTVCAKDPALRRLIDATGMPVDRCSLCKTEHARAVQTDARDVRALLRALVRLHFREVQYNTHFGGDHLSALLSAENPVVRHDFDPIDIEEATWPALEDGYEGPNVPISLHAGYGHDGHQNMLLEPMSAEDEPRLQTLRGRVATTNHYLLDAEVRVLLVPHLARLRRELPADTSFHRARIGKESTQFDGFDYSARYVPYSGEKLAAPMPIIAGAGRLNRAGVSMLYLASDQATAINEVRPHPGHLVSTGQFRSTSPLSVADFSSVRIEEFTGSDTDLQEYWLLHSIDRAFGVPVPPEERARYMVTQLLTDTLRHLGFDGVAYRSSVGNGINVAVFDPRPFGYVADSARIVRIERVDYQHVTLPIPEP